MMKEGVSWKSEDEEKTLYMELPSKVEDTLHSLPINKLYCIVKHMNKDQPKESQKWSF